MKIYPYALPKDELFSEIVDMQDNPLMIIPHEQMLQSNIPHRKVYVFLHDGNGRIFLQPSNNTKKIRIPSSSVFAGEAREYATMRIIKSILKLDPERPLTLEEYTISSYKYYTFFLVFIDAEYQKALGSTALWMDKDELQGFVTHFSDMLDTDLLDFIGNSQVQDLNIYDIKTSTKFKY